MTKRWGEEETENAFVSKCRKPPYFTSQIKHRSGDISKIFQQNIDAQNEMGSVESYVRCESITNLI